MKTLDFSTAQFNIAERDDYTLTLMRENEEQYLYGVMIIGPFSTERVYVLAEDEKGAIAQARCAVGMQDYHTPSEVEAQITIHIERLPLVIRGWSNIRF